MHSPAIRERIGSTGFEFASVTKVMTAVLIADLAGEGLIDLDASFSSYFTAR
jgi:CubicO group peptidase (beta-lactamase class C family)